MLSEPGLGITWGDWNQDRSQSLRTGEGSWCEWKAQGNFSPGEGTMETPREEGRGGPTFSPPAFLTSFSASQRLSLFPNSERKGDREVGNSNHRDHLPEVQSRPGERSEGTQARKNQSSFSEVGEQSWGENKRYDAIKLNDHGKPL